MALLSVMVVILVLTLLGGLVLHLSGQEMHLSTVRYRAAQSLNIAEGGAFAARAALMVVMNADPIGKVSVHPSLSGPTMARWYAEGVTGSQDSFGIFDYLVLDGQRLTLDTTSTTPSVAFEVNWGLATPHRKLQVATGSPPLNPLGEGGYRATIVVSRRKAGDPPRYIQRLGPDHYEFYFTYSITSDGQVDPQFRRRVTLTGDFSMQVRRQNFARFLLFSDVHTGPGGEALWFASMSNYDGWVHTNGEFRFAFFPKFGTPDSGTDCDPRRIRETPLTSAGTHAIFFNRGSPRRLDRNENVVDGVRRDAPVLPDCTPANLLDDNDNPPANFTRGVARIELPDNPYSQKGVSIGLDPTDLARRDEEDWNLAIRRVVPELPDNDDDVPAGVYVPNDGRTPPSLLGGIFVQGDLRSLTLHTAGPTGNLARYVFVHRNGQTVTVTVDRASNLTTVTHSDWDPITPGNQSGTRTFSGVPKGYQGHGHENATIVFVNGNIGHAGGGLSGTLEEEEQTTIVATGHIDITNHLRYEVPPRVTDPNHNPLNVLGLYSANGEIRIVVDPNDPATFNLDIHAMMMAGTRGDGFRSRVYNLNWNRTPVRGTIRHIGGTVGEYLGVMGVMDATGRLIRGYGMDARYDRRMMRGLVPPYFPTTGLFEVQGVGLAGVRPMWREGSPP
jgi:hypothetical protein